MSGYYDMRTQKRERLLVPYSTRLLLTYTEIAIPIPDTPAPALGEHNTCTPKLISIMLQRVRQSNCKNSVNKTTVFNLFIHLHSFHEPFLKFVQPFTANEHGAALTCL